MNLKESKDNTYWKVARALDLENKLKDTNIAIQGELCGESIQSNRLKIKGQTFLAYNAYHLKEQRYLNFDEFIEFTKKLLIYRVPLVDKKFHLGITVDEAVNYATTKSRINPNVWAEGIVIRPVVETTDPDLGSLSFKVINPEYLLKHGE
jgi:RNA ligase (TIGR02306 family)